MDVNPASRASKPTMWRLFHEGANSGANNMARDLAILRGVEAGESPPTIRIYQWQRPTLSLGHSQNFEREVNLKRIQQLGWDVSRRFTGGRAVLHTSELTYSLIAPLDEEWTGSLSSAYAFIGEILAKALNQCGWPVALEKGDSSEGISKGGVSKPCFASTSRSEVLLQGRKLIGSAQRRTRNAFLQHGSILLNKGHLDIVKALNIDSQEQTIQRDMLAKSAICLEEYDNSKMPFKESQEFRQILGEALARVFLNTFKGRIQEEDSLDAGELQRTQDLLDKARLWEVA